MVETLNIYTVVIAGFKGPRFTTRADAERERAIRLRHNPRASIHVIRQEVVTVGDPVQVIP